MLEECGLISTLYLQNSKYCTIQQEVGGSCVCVFLYIFTHKLKQGGGGVKVGVVSLGLGYN